MARAKRPKEVLPDFDPAVLDQLLGGARSHEAFDALVRAFQKRISERILAGELTDHLGYPPGEARPPGETNHRNGTTPKTVTTANGALALDIPRDREGTFAPQFIPTGVRRLPKFDAHVLALYARGVTVRDIQAHLEELYQVPIATTVISAVTDEVLGEVRQWQERPLERCYPVVLFDALRVKIRDEGVVRNKAVYVALGIDREGHKDVLGLWVEQTEGASFWLRVMSDLKSRGVEDVLIALVDGLAGFPDAITAVFPQAQVHHCVVHLVRQSLKYVAARDRKALAAALRAIYKAPTGPAAVDALEAFAVSPWGQKLSAVVALWRRHWPYVEPIFTFPPEIRTLLYTTNAIESLNRVYRKALKTRGHFPTDDAALKLLYLAQRAIIAQWKRESSRWKAAMPFFSQLFGARFTHDL